ncbi:MAG TPA: protein kinase [Polyangiaceae bacterium]|nr:protein kinase [Polyangiaceae bacterium]
MSVAEAEKPPGDLVAGKYRLTRLLGRGGMGSVWEGVHTSLGTHVAVKFIETEHATSSEARNRFENEARAAAKLRSKHVVQVYDHGVSLDGRPFIVMEFLAGEPLDRRLDRVNRLSPADTARIVHQVCRALGRAHEAGIVHRDLKPENVFLVWDEEDGADVVKVVDFGIAKFTDGSMGVSSATRTGSVLGTPYYMSPEQARGLRSVDHRSDLWSVGVIAYRCLVGELPFQGEAIGDLLVKICTAELPVPSQRAPGVPQSFDAWFAKALDREPARRFESAAATSQALNAAFGLAARSPQAAAGGQGSSAVTPGLTTPMHQGPMYFTPQHGALTPAPMQSGVHPGHISAPSQFDRTGSPLTASSAGGKSSRGALFAVIFAVCLVLGVGIAVAAKLLRRSDSPPVAAEAASSPVPEPSPPAAKTKVAPEVLPTVPPATSASAAPEPVAPASGRPRAARPARSSGKLPAARVESPKTKPPAKANSGAIDLGY